MELTYSFSHLYLIPPLEKRTQWVDEVCGHIICFITRYISYNKEYLLNKWKMSATNYQGRKKSLNFRVRDLGTDDWENRGKFQTNVNQEDGVFHNDQ